MTSLSNGDGGRFDLIIFDCDGVLVDSEAISEAVVCRLMAEIGIAMTPADVARLSRGRSTIDMWTRFEQEYALTVPRELRKRLEDDERLALSNVKAIAGAPEVVRKLAAKGRPICVASSGTKDKLAVTLAATGLAPYFEGRVFSASEVASGKPAPDLFLHAARSLGVEPARCLVIEDSRNGVLAGLAADMTVFGYAPPGNNGSLDDLGVRLLQSMAELEEILGV